MRPGFLATHQHGGDPASAMAGFGLAPGPVIDFSVNTNPLGAPEAVMHAWPALMRHISRYPSVEGLGLKRFYQERFSIAAECVLPGNGSIELLYLIPRALGLRRALVPVPSFHDYQRALHLAGAGLTVYELEPAKDFAALTREEWEEIIHRERPDALIIGNPNNPTGSLTSRRDLLDLAEAYPRVIFLVDEAFVQFLEEPGSVSLLHRDYIRPNLLILHSLTKFYCLPGLRMGAVISHPDTINRLRACKEPWSLNAVAEHVVPLLADCPEYEHATRVLMARQRVIISQELAHLAGIKLFSSAAPFFLAQVTGGRDLDQLLKALLEHGLFVRDCRNFTGLRDNFFRFAIRTANDNARLIRALKKTAGGFYA